MSQMYRTFSKSNGQEVRLYECTINKDYNYCIFVNGREHTYLDNLRDAYKLYNELAR